MAPLPTVTDLWADRLLARPGAAATSHRRRVVVADGRVDWVGEGEAGPDDLAGPGSLVMPALANAHDHGRGVRPLAYGVADAPVELWVPGTYGLPPVDPYLVAAVAFGRMARAGVGSILHCHLWRPPEQLIEEAGAVARAAADIGVRVAFVAPVRDRHRLGYGDDGRIMAHVAPEAREAVAAVFQRDIPDIEAQLAAVEEIAVRHASPTFHVQYGPVGVEWCSDRLLGLVAERAAAHERRIHMHFLESARQRAWADETYPDGIVEHLGGVGLLGPRLSLAHGVWLRTGECERLAAAGVTLSVNSSSNLRLRSGIAPLARIHRAGLRFALGLDALALDDDEDMLRELRLAARLQGGTGLDPALPLAAYFNAAMRNGPWMMFGEEGFGAIETGAPADLLVLDHATLSADLIDGLIDEAELVLARACAGHVRALVVGGRAVVCDGAIAGLDLPAAEAELTEQLNCHAEAVRAGGALLASFQAALRRYYATDEAASECC